MRIVSLLALSFALGTAVSLWSQRRGIGPTGPAPGGGFESGIFLSGTVVLEDGIPLGEPATVERICYGERYAQTYTDRKGRFNFNLGASPSWAFGDASAGSLSSGPGVFRRSEPAALRVSPPSRRIGRVDLRGCELRASLAGYRFESIQLGVRSTFDKPSVGVMILRRLEGGEGVTISATSLAVPKKARKSYEKAVRELSKKSSRSGKPTKAIKELEKAVEEYPEYAAAWNLLGQARLSIDDKVGARDAFQKAMEADDKYLGPYLPLLRMELQGQRWKEVDEISTRLLRLNPETTEARFYRAVANFNLGNLEMAEQLAVEIQSGKDARKLPQTHHLLGMIHAKKGKFPLAVAEYKSYLRSQPFGPVAEQVRRQLAEWEASGMIKKAPAVPVGTSAK